MRKVIIKFSALLAIIMLVGCFQSCSEETKDVTKEYTITYSEIKSSSTEELNTIDNTYKAQIGVTQDQFTLSGDTKSNDSKVKLACEKAQNILSSKTFKGYYVLKVTRGTVDIHTATYGTK